MIVLEFFFHEWQMLVDFPDKMYVISELVMD
jgi:hypothetical protein